MADCSARDCGHATAESLVFDTLRTTQSRTVQCTNLLKSNAQPPLTSSPSAPSLCKTTARDRSPQPLISITRPQHHTHNDEGSNSSCDADTELACPPASLRLLQTLLPSRLGLHQRRVDYTLAVYIVEAVDVHVVGHAHSGNNGDGCRSPDRQDDGLGGLVGRRWWEDAVRVVNVVAWWRRFVP